MTRSAQDFDRIDTSLFRAFLAAAETLNFTRAAEQAGMTQSGVSQHIAKLEGQLGLPLFTRANKTILLTDAGRHFVTHVNRYLDATDALCDKLRNANRQLVGLVSYAMPGSCLLSPHLAMMLEKKRKFPDIELRISIRPNEEVIQGLLLGDFDFGFVTEERVAPGISLRHFCDEEFVLAIAKNSAIPTKMDEVLALDFVTYPGMEGYFNAWQKYYFPKTKKRVYDSLTVKGHIDSIHGAMTLAAGGVGAIVVPRHCLETDGNLRRMRIVYPDSKKTPLMNRIYIANLSGQQATRRCMQVKEWFFEMFP